MREGRAEGSRTDHAAAGGVSKVKVVKVADEALELAIGHLRGAWQRRRGTRADQSSVGAVCRGIAAVRCWRTLAEEAGVAAAFAAAAFAACGVRCCGVRQRTQGLGVLWKAVLLRVVNDEAVAARLLRWLHAARLQAQRQRGRRQRRRR